MPLPADDYTPHGYLDLPGHTRRLTPKGVLRTHDLGFRWHFPALATSYGGRRETYRAGVRLGLDGAWALADFDRVTAPYHSKNLVRFEASRGAAGLEAEFFTVDDDVLCAYVWAGPNTPLHIRVDYTRLIAADHGWGESGLVGRQSPDGLVLQGFEDGEAFALQVTGSPGPHDLELTAGDENTADGPVTVLGSAGSQITVSGVVTLPALDTVSPAPSSAVPAWSPEVARGRGAETPDDPRFRCLVLLARGRTADEAQARLASARRTAGAVRAARLADDERFWAQAPRLEGDWPAHWRRGLVYDLETIRTMVKEPAGIYRQLWDAMQIQAPRVVLAEAAIDALLLGYADPRTAQELLLGTFADAPLPNVPCSREDGSYTMVSADGTVCGTGPQWGYPWLVARQLFGWHPDRQWLARLYPHLAGYLDWWLTHRRDADGFLVHACSWESGQDLSPRFGAQPLGGGHPTWTTRPVDLQAAFAHAAQVMAEFATELGAEHDLTRWRQLAAEFSTRTEQLWHAGRYADVDTATGAFTEVDDVMLLAPLALGLSGPERGDALRPDLRAMDADSVVWPMFAWTAVEAADAAGEHAVSARIAGAVVDRAYTFWDARTHDESRTLPGVACEYWPVSGRCGGEGYGWGAFTTHLLLGVLLGLRATSDRLRLRPNLPVELRTPGHRYLVRMTLRGLLVVIALRPVDEGVEVAVGELTAKLGWGEEVGWSWEDVACAARG